MPECAALDSVLSRRPRIPQNREFIRPDGIFGTNLLIIPRGRATAKISLVSGRLAVSRHFFFLSLSFFPPPSSLVAGRAQNEKIPGISRACRSEITGETATSSYLVCRDKAKKRRGRRGIKKDIAHAFACDILSFRTYGRRSIETDARPLAKRNRSRSHRCAPNGLNHGVVLFYSPCSSLSLSFFFFRYLRINWNISKARGKQ